MCGANQIKIWTEGPSIWRGRVGTWVPRQEGTRGNLGSPPGGDAFWCASACREPYGHRFAMPWRFPVKKLTNYFCRL